MITRVITCLSAIIFLSTATLANSAQYQYYSDWGVLKRIEKGKPVAICTFDDWTAENSGHSEMMNDFIVFKNNWEEALELVRTGACHVIAIKEDDKPHLDAVREHEIKRVIFN